MPRFIKPTRKRAGSAPGTLVHVGDKRTEEARITLVDYTPDQIEERTESDISLLAALRDSETTTWINIDGLHDPLLIESIGDGFQIHPLTLEDILNTGQRPKVEEFDGYLHFVLKMLRLDEKENEVVSEQVSLVLGPRFLLSFQEAPGDVFTPVRERLRNARQRIRRSGCDYLAYALLDAVVDHYFLIMEELGERIEMLEEQLTGEPKESVHKQIHALKHEVIFLRKQVWPMRELLNRLTKGEFELIGDKHRVFWNDVYDHIVQLMDTIESYRDVLSGLLDLYLSTISNRMNEVMKVLTIMATIFIPITFIAGVYGMNFRHMPELEWPWGYGAVWLIMIAIVAVMILMFKKKKWL